MNSKTIVGQGHSTSANLKIINYSGQTETFNVTVQANTTTIQTKTVTLTSRNSTPVTFTWNTAGFALGNYTITSATDPVLGETDTTDNTHVDVTVLVTIPGDVNGDGKVRIDDVLAVAVAFGSDYDDSWYNPNLDINGDLKIRIDDVLIAAKNFGLG